MRKGRLFQWILAVIIAGLLVKAGEHKDYKATLPDESEKQAITVCVPEDMESAFDSALAIAELKETYKIIMTDKEDNADICIGYAKQNDESYKKIFYSPFVIAYNTSGNCQAKLIESGVFTPALYDKDQYEVDFLKIINEAIGKGNWANFNLEEQGELKVFYPRKDTRYWHDFHDFLLVTVNNGKYPKNETEKQKAEKIIEKFLNSKYTEGIVDFYEQVLRTGGFPENAIYVLPEQDVISICEEQKTKADIYYPTNTVYFNYYIKGKGIGEQIIDCLGEVKEVGLFTSYNFYYATAAKGYRSIKYPDLKRSSDYANYERDMYNVVIITELATPSEPSNLAEPTISTSE